MKKLPSLSIFYPSLNDAKILPYLIYKTSIIAAQVSHKYEIIVINDGSTDDTYEVLEGLKQIYKKLRPIHHAKNTGYGGALQAGFREARYEWVFYTDGDGQYDPMELPKLVKHAKKTIDCVNGYKINRLDNPMRKIAGNAYNRVLQKMHSLPIRDVDCDFRLIRKSVLDTIELHSLSGMICLELMLKLQEAGARFNEVGVSHYPRRFGRSQFFNVKPITATVLEHLALLKSKYIFP